MIRKFVPALLLALLCSMFLPSALWAEEVTVEYVEGLLELKNGNKWTEIEIGDILAPTDTIRIGEESVAELSYKKSLIIIHEAGSYSLKELLNEGNDRGAFNLSSIMENKWETLLHGPDTNLQAASMGARATEAPLPDQVMWADAESFLFDEGLALIEAGKFREAVDYLSVIEDQITEEERDEFNYYLGYSYIMLGEKGKALGLLLKIKESDSTDFYSDLILLKGNLLMEAHSYKNALDLFDLYVKARIEDRNRDHIYLLSGICLVELERYPDARKRFTELKSASLPPDLEEMVDKWLDFIKHQK